MRKLNNLWGFRTNKLWKKIIATFYYLFALNLIITTLNDTPQISAKLYDFLINKLSSFLKASAFLIPILFISDFKFKDKIPLLKKKKLWSDILGFIIIFITIFLVGNKLTLLHSNDYIQKYNEYSATKIIYSQHENDKIADEEKSTLTENELVNNLDEITKENEITIENNEQLKKENIKIHYLDVEQGDSIFIELPNNETMLIDAGESSKEKIISNYIKKLDYTKIDYLIGTHPHADHIGGLAHIINNFNIGKIYMPKAVSTSKTYENLLTTILENDLKVTAAKAGVKILNRDDLKVEIIAPCSNSYEDLNNYSAVIKITFKNNNFLFMGDAETKSENEIQSNIKSNVIKIGHHGSNTSSSQSFINKVKPEYVIISVGENNKYDHPNQSIIDRWKNTGAEIYRTDLNGNIVVISDGNAININTSK